MNFLKYFYEEPVSIHLGTWVSVGDIQINYGLLLDSLSMTVLVPVGIVTLLVIFYALDYMRHDPNRNRFYIILSVFAIFMTVLVVSDNYIMMFIGWEFVGVVSYLLISFWSTRISAMKSALSALLLNRMGDTFFVICIGTMLSLFHAVDFETIELVAPHTDTLILNLIGLMLLLAATAKSAQLGLHSWLLLAMEGWVYRALVKFHYMREHPNTVWSSLFVSYTYFNHIFINRIQHNNQLAEEDIPTERLYSIYKSSEKSKLPLNDNYLEYGQHSGNLLKGSSETLRETFYNNDLDFINWLIGFTEGDGSFIINNNNKYLEFKITQSSNDAQILFYIKKTLGFGRVSVQDKINKTHHYRVRDKEGLLKIINIFNGKLCLTKYQNKFIQFVNQYNKTYNTNIEVLNFNNKPSLEDAWLSGFTDAEGCFTLSIFKNKYISIRYILSQKNEDILITYIANLLKSKTYKLKKCGTVNMTVNKTNLPLIIKYLTKYPLKTKKLITYNNWLNIYKRDKNKEYKDPIKFQFLIKKIYKL